MISKKRSMFDYPFVVKFSKRRFTNKSAKKRIRKDLKFFMEEDPIGKMVYDGLDEYDRRKVE